jgi:hypothetical protein
MGMNPRLLRPTASGFDPRRISGLVGWYDASDRATLFDATTGGSAVAADGAVGRWQDKSGSANHLTQGTANNRPTLKENIQAGRSILRLDGTNDSLAFTTINSFTGAFSLFAVFYETSVRFIAAGGNDSSFFGSGYVAGGGILFRNTIDAGMTITDANPNRFVLIAGIRSGTGTNQTTVRRDGGTINATGTVAGTFNAANVGLRNPSQFSGGDIAELLVFNLAVSNPQRSAIEAYLKQKWTIS